MRRIDLIRSKNELPYGAGFVDGFIEGYKQALKELRKKDA